MNRSPMNRAPARRFMAGLEVASAAGLAAASGDKHTAKRSRACITHSVARRRLGRWPVVSALIRVTGKWVDLAAGTVFSRRSVASIHMIVARSMGSVHKGMVRPAVLHRKAMVHRMASANMGRDPKPASANIAGRAFAAPCRKVVARKCGMNAVAPAVMVLRLRSTGRAGTVVRSRTTVGQESMAVMTTTTAAPNMSTAPGDRVFG
jgi:hypothetical protein